MRKFFILLLVIVFAAVFSAAGVYAEENETELPECMERLSAFGIISGDLDISSADEALTRKEAAVWLCRALSVESEHDICVFDDLETGSEAANAAMSLWQLGIVSNGENGMFRPSKNISYTDFSVMLINALNYSDLAKAYGGYPVGYVKAADSLKLNKKVKAVQELTLKQGAQMLCNALDIKMLDSSKTLLEHYKGIRHISGRVTADSKTSLTLPEPVAAGNIKIDDEVFGTDISGQEWLGKYADAYYTDADGKNTLVYIAADKEFKEITVAPDDIEKDRSSRTSVVYEENGREKKLAITPAADIIYNGRAYPDLPIEKFYPSCGSIRALDSDNDGKYDVLFIDSYDVMFVRNVVPSSKSIYNKFDKGSFCAKLTIENDADFDIFDLYGETVKLEEISVNNIVLVAKAATGSSPYYKIIVSDNARRGKLSKISDENITVDDEEFEVSDAFSEALSLKLIPELKTGSEYYFYFDAFGKIAAYETAGEEKMYGYLKRAKYDEESDINYLTIFTQDNVWRTYDLRDKVTYNKESMSAEAVAESIGKGIMLRYELDAKQRIKAIETAEKIVPDDEETEQKIKKNVFRKSDISSLLNNNKYYSMNKSFQNTFFAEEDAKVFLIPTDKGASDDDFKCTDLSYFASESRYEASVYDYDKYMFSKLFVVEYDSSKSDYLSTSLGDSDYCMMVSKTFETVVNNDCVSGVKGLLKGEEWSYISTEPDTFEGLRRGDIIRTKYDDSGKLRQYVTVHRFGTENLKSSVSDVNNAKYIFGDVLSVDYENRRMRIDEGNKLTVIITESAYVTVYDSQNDELRSGTIQDISDNDYVVLRMRTSVPYEIFVIKK